MAMKIDLETTHAVQQGVERVVLAAVNPVNEGFAEKLGALAKTVREGHSLADILKTPNSEHRESLMEMLNVIAPLPAEDSEASSATEAAKARQRFVDQPQLLEGVLSVSETAVPDARTDKAGTMDRLSQAFNSLRIDRTDRLGGDESYGVGNLDSLLRTRQ